MFKRTIYQVKENSLKFSMCLLASSLFLGNAMLSMSFVLLIVVSIPYISKGAVLINLIKDKLLLLPVFYALICISISLFNIEEIAEIIPLIKFLPFVVLPVIFYSIKEQFIVKNIYDSIQKTYFITAVVSCLINMIYGCFRWIKLDNSIYLTYNYFSELFGVQPIYLSIFYLMAILFAIDIIIKNKLFKKGYFLGAIILFLGILLAGSRTSLLVAIITILSRTILLYKNKKSYLILVGSVLILGVSILSAFPNLKNRFFKFNQDVSSYSGSSFRIKIWENALRTAQYQPFFGYGYTNSQDALMRQYEKVNFRRAYIYGMNTHNQYLQTTLDAGLLGLLLLIIMLFMPLLRRANSITAIAFYLIIIVSLITESFFRRQFGVVFYSFFFSLFYLQQLNSIKLGPDFVKVGD